MQNFAKVALFSLQSQGKCVELSLNSSYMSVYLSNNPTITDIANNAPQTLFIYLFIYLSLFLVVFLREQKTVIYHVFVSSEHNQNSACQIPKRLWIFELASNLPSHRIGTFFFLNFPLFFQKWKSCNFNSSGNAQLRINPSVSKKLAHCYGDLSVRR